MTLETSQTARRRRQVTPRLAAAAGVKMVPVTSAEAPDILTPREAAEFLRLSESMLRKARRQGALAFIKFGRAVRYRRDDLLLYSERHELNHESGVAALAEEIVQRLKR